MNTVANVQEGRADPQSAEKPDKTPAFWLSELTFSDGTAVTLGRNSVLVIVGPNNAGKSETLRAINALAENHEARSPVVRSARFRRDGTQDEFTKWLNRVPTRQTSGGQTNYSLSGASIPSGAATHLWDRGDSHGLQTMARWFCAFLSAESRMQASNSPTTIDRRSGQPPTHPIHLLQVNETLAAKASKLFRKAFGADLIVDSTPSSSAHLLCGTAPIRGPGEDRLSTTYLTKLSRIPLLMKQGDGMRSFAGVMLHLIAGHENILLIDEPEAFLHPPQARLLGKTLVESKRSDCQLVIATHSSDLVRGMLDVLNDDVCIVRVRRDGATNVARPLDAKQVRELWGDPLLRYSNILDGLFHERTVVCESDADCRFYSAVIDAMSDKGGEDARQPDILFTHVGGKDRIPVAVRALMRWPWA
jgi:energy-coupling factor transporter ATP-binding protein EcfA2